MTRDEIDKRFETFFEWDTDDRSIVTSTSAKLFAEHVASQSLARQRTLIASWVADMCQGLDASTIAEAIRNGGNDAMDSFKVSK